MPKRTTNAKEKFHHEIDETRRAYIQGYAKVKVKGSMVQIKIGSKGRKKPLFDVKGRGYKDAMKKLSKAERKLSS